MKIISVSDDQNTIKTDDGKKHEFVITEESFTLCKSCSLYFCKNSCFLYCDDLRREDKKDGYFKLKGEN